MRKHSLYLEENGSTQLLLGYLLKCGLPQSTAELACYKTGPLYFSALNEISSGLISLRLININTNECGFEFMGIERSLASGQLATSYNGKTLSVFRLYVPLIGHFGG